MSATPATLFSQLRGKARTGILIEGIGLGLAVLVGYMLVSFALDRTLRLETVYRACLLAICIFGIWHVLRRSVFKPIGFVLTDDELALAVERGEDLHQSLISAVQFERVIAKGPQGNESTELMQHVVRDVYGRVHAIRNKSALDVGRVRKFTGVILGCLVAIGTWGVLDADSLLLWAKRNLFMSSVDWPRKTALRFSMDEENGVVRIPEGNDLTVEVFASGELPDQVFIEYVFPDGSSGREPMALTGGDDQPAPTGADPAKAKITGGPWRFTWLMESVISSATLHAVGGDAARRSIEIELVKRPVIEDLEITRTFPAYMKLDPAPLNTSEGDVRLPAGAQLSIKGRSTKELKDAYLIFGQEAKVSLDVDPKTSTFQGSFTPVKSGVLTLDVTDRDDLGAGKPPKFFLRMVKDAAPVVDYKTMGIGSMILFKALIPGNLKIRDDFGITKVVSKIRISGGRQEKEGAEPGAMKDREEEPWEVVPFDDMRQPSVEENEVDYAEKVVFDLASRNDIALGQNAPQNPIRPGMLLSILFESTDNFGPGEPHLGASEVLTLRVVEEEKLMQDLHRRQGERRRELTQILEKEKGYKGEIEEIVSPNSDDPRAKLAKLRLRAIARDQLALKTQIIGVAQRYELILDEYFNNRIFEPSQILKQRQAIQIPLEKLAQENFPTSAQEVEDFAHDGLPEQRTVAAGSYDTIIKVLEEVISNMSHLESVAFILDEVRRIREMERKIESDSKKALDKEDAGAKKVETPKKTGEKAPGGNPPSKK